MIFLSILLVLINYVKNEDKIINKNDATETTNNRADISSVGEKKEESFVKEYSATEINTMLNTFPSLIFFYMSDDPLSLKIKKNFEEAAPKLKKYGLPVGEFDCSKGPEKCKRAQIQEIPDIKFLQFVYYLLT